MMWLARFFLLYSFYIHPTATLRILRLAMGRQSNSSGRYSYPGNSPASYRRMADPLGRGGQNRLHHQKEQDCLPDNRNSNSCRMLMEHHSPLYQSRS